MKSWQQSIQIGFYGRQRSASEKGQSVLVQPAIMVTTGNRSIIVIIIIIIIISLVL